MGRLKHLFGNRINIGEAAFLVLAVGLYLGMKPLPVPVLAKIALVSSVLVKAVGLPAQLRTVVKTKSVSGLSLSRNVIDYYSYLVLWLYGLGRHDLVLIWGMGPGVFQVALLTLLNLRHGSFPWRRLPNRDGHFTGQVNCRSCISIAISTLGHLDVAPSGSWQLTSEVVGHRDCMRLVRVDPDRYGGLVNLERCSTCGGLLHLRIIVNAPDLVLWSDQLIPTIRVQFMCDGGNHLEDYVLSFQPVTLSAPYTAVLFEHMG